jgi:hypothetical protein
MIRPDGNGNYSAWVGSDADSTDNYLHVDEDPHDSDTSYVETDTATNRDSYTMDNYTLPTGFSVAAVIPMAIAKKVDAGGAVNIQLFTRESATDADSATKTLGTDYQLHNDRQTTKPSGGNWDQTSINAVEVGVEAV